MSNDDNCIERIPGCSIFEIAADLLANQDLLAKVPVESTEAISMVQRLLLSLGSGNSTDLEKCLIAFGVRRESQLFEEVGHMARTLHDSLNDFKSSLAPESMTMSTTNIPDATDKLEAVIKMTFDAANKTMDSMEQQSRILSELKADLTAYKLRCSPSQQTDSFFARLESRIATLDCIASETLVGQSFQDLTGQSIKKVIKLVTELENNLVSIIKVFGLKEGHKSGSREIGTEQENATQSRKVNQDDVDALLSDLGF